MHIAEKWPTAARIAGKLARGEPLTREEAEWLREAAWASGWTVDDLAEDLAAALREEPKARAGHYLALARLYLAAAKTRLRRGDARGAALRGWGAATALVKYLAALRGEELAQWDLEAMERFAAGLPGTLWKIAGDVLAIGHVLLHKSELAEPVPELVRGSLEDIGRLADLACRIVFGAPLEVGGDG